MGICGFAGALFYKLMYSAEQEFRGEGRVSEAETHSNGIRLTVKRDGDRSVMFGDRNSQ